MLKLVTTGRFEKDYKRVEKRHKSLDKLWVVVGMLLTGRKLPERYRDHFLKGNYVGRRECHIEPDWLLVYKVEERSLILERTGTHADLFD